MHKKKAKHFNQNNLFAHIPLELYKFIYVYILLYNDIIQTLHMYRMEVKKYTFRGSNSTIFMFAFLGNKGGLERGGEIRGGGYLLKERICSFRSRFFPLRENSLLEGFCHPGKQTGNHKSCSPL